MFPTHDADYRGDGTQHERIVRITDVSTGRVELEDIWLADDDAESNVRDWDQIERDIHRYRRAETFKSKRLAR